MHYSVHFAKAYPERTAKLCTLVVASLTELAGKLDDSPENDAIVLAANTLVSNLLLDGNTYEDLAAMFAEAWELCSAY